MKKNSRKFWFESFVRFNSKLFMTKIFKSNSSLRLTANVLSKTKYNETPASSQIEHHPNLHWCLISYNSNQHCSSPSFALQIISFSSFPTSRRPATGNCPSRVSSDERCDKIEEAFGSSSWCLAQPKPFEPRVQLPSICRWTIFDAAAKLD